MASNRDRPLVLCLHGFPDSPQTFRWQLPALADAGYRALAPMMRGYEPSSQPEDEDYRIATMARDVLAWIDELGEEQVHLVGHDWGAAVTYAAGALAPDRFASLTTIAVPHAARLRKAIWRVPSQIFKLWYMSFFQLRGIAEWALERKDWALLRRLVRNWSPGLDLTDADWEHLRSTFEAPGVKRAALSYYRQNVSPTILFGLKITEAMKLRTVPVRTLVIAGDEDGCMDPRIYEHAFEAEDFPAGFRIERIAAAGHFAQLEQPDRVNALLLDWLGQSPPAVRQ
jgi:pimeloyl-ACP methyl ester carboxylesterase